MLVVLVTNLIAIFHFSIPIDYKKRNAAIDAFYFSKKQQSQ